MKVKAAHHIGLVTPHFNEMRKFYADTLGLAEVREWPDVPIVFFDIGSSTIELIGRESSTAETRPTGGWDHLALHVDSVDDAYAELVEKASPSETNRATSKTCASASSSTRTAT